MAKTISGLLTPKQGKIIFKVENIARVQSDKIIRYGMCYVPQISNVFSALTIDENLKVGAFFKKCSLKEDKDRICTMFPRLGQHRRQRAGRLSGGERQMLAMERALMLDLICYF